MNLLMKSSADVNFMKSRVESAIKELSTSLIGAKDSLRFCSNASHVPNPCRCSWGVYSLALLRLGVERRGEDERDRQERRAGLCAARLELGSTGRAGDKDVLREVSTERNTWGAHLETRGRN